MSRSHPDNMPEPVSPQRPERCKGGLFRANLKAHLDGEMSAARNWLVRWHLAQCTECREELRWLRRLGEDMKELESARPRPELRARIMANLPSTPPAPGIRVVHSRPDRERAPRLAPRLALAGGFAMVLAFSAVFALHLSNTAPTGQSDLGKIARSGVPQSKIAPGSALVQNSSDLPVSEPKPYTPAVDPYNDLADKLAREEIADREREKRLQGQDDLHRLLAQARAVARKTNTSANTDMGIALAVPDVAAVRAHLPGWARKEGVKLVLNGQPASETPASTSSPVPEGMVAFYVPAERGPAFLGALKQLGQISMLPLASRMATASNQRTETGAQVELDHDRKLKAVPTAPTPEAGIPIEKTVVPHETPAKAPRYLVLTVLLQSVTHN